MKRRSRTLLEEPSMNLTPLIDVVFVILIMFIVVAPLLQLERIDLAGTASPEKEAISQKSPLCIYVFEDNSIKINQKPVQLDHLKVELASLKERFPSLRPQLFYDKKATFGTYQSIKNVLESVGFKEMDVILKPSTVE